VADIGASAQQGATVIAHQGVLDRMSAPTGTQPAMPSAAWPTDTYNGQEKELFFNGEAIQMFHEPVAHTDGEAGSGNLCDSGHGRLSDEADVVEFRDIATIIRDRIQDMVKKGMMLEQVKAAKPTRDYDPRYGAEKGFWTTDKSVEAVYKSLSPTK
jgi:hypothetical protein